MEMRVGNLACSNVTEYMDCSPTSKFRKIDGTCNNLNNPRLGSPGTQIKRILPGISTLFNIPTYLTKPVKSPVTPTPQPHTEGEGMDRYSTAVAKTFL